MSARFAFEAKLWRYQGKAAWHFVTVPEDVSAQVRALTRGLSAAFGSVRVIASIGETSWRTSVFADAKTRAYLLPLKGEIRRRPNLAEGEAISLTLEIDL